MSTPNYDGNPIAYLAALEGKLDPLAAQAALQLLKPALADLYSTDRTSFGLAADLIKEKLGINRRDLVVAITPPVNTSAGAEAKPPPAEEEPPDPEYTGDLFAYLAALKNNLDPRRTQEEVTLLKPDLANLYTTDRAAFAVAANLIKEKLGVGRRDLEASIKPLREGEGNSSQATRLVELAEQITLFHTPDGEGWATLPLGEHQEHWAIRSKGFRRSLARQFYEEERKAPGSQAVQDALTVLEGKAVHEGEEQTVFVRIAEYEDKLYVDLANPDWQAVEITSTAWRVADCPPVPFRRSKAMLPLPIPTTGGTIEDLWPFVNVRKEDRELVVAWLLMCFSPRGPYPVLGLSGGQGTTKSTTARVLRSLIDPFAAPLRSPPREERDLMISASGGRVLAFDNLSYLPQWLSDAFCRLATGGGFSTRELYSNDEETIFDAQRPVLFTSIGDIAVEGDLIDRGIRLLLPPISAKERKAESAFWAEFEKARPSILGALLDVLVVILRRRSQVKLKKLPRMADFVEWVAAGAPALGWKVNDFLSAYERNRFVANELTLDASTVAKAILILAQSEPWEGTAAELLEALIPFLSERETKARQWPKTPLALSNALRRLVPSLQTAGITVEFGKSDGKNSRRMISIRTEPQPSDASDASDASEEEPSEEPNFAQDSRDDDASLHDDLATPSDAPPFGASAKNSNKINGADASVDSVAQKHSYSKPDPLTDAEVFE